MARNPWFRSSLIVVSTVLEQSFGGVLCQQYRHGLRLQGMNAAQLLYSTWGIRVSTYITCSINNSPLGPTRFNLTMNYNYVPATVRSGDESTFLGSAFLNRNHTTQSSLYWGESLLSTTWAEVCQQMEDTGSDLDPGPKKLIKGLVNYRRRPESVAAITDPGFFDVFYVFTYSITPSPMFGNMVPPIKVQFPDIWSTADVLAKAAYSTVLTDLGQTKAPHNLLVDADQLEHFTANFSHWRQYIKKPRPGPAKKDNATLKNSTGPLEVKPSVFVRDYLCQVPRRKALPNLVVSVLVADLVFLQATWQIYKLVVEYFFVKRISRSQWFEGCKASAETFPLTQTTSREDLSCHS
jgi:hypothetical protein